MTPDQIINNTKCTFTKKEDGSYELNVTMSKEVLEEIDKICDDVNFHAETSYKNALIGRVIAEFMGDCKSFPEFTRRTIWFIETVGSLGAAICHSHTMDLLGNIIKKKMDDKGASPNE